MRNGRCDVGRILALAAVFSRARSNGDDSSSSTSGYKVASSVGSKERWNKGLGVGNRRASSQNAAARLQSWSREYRRNAKGERKGKTKARLRRLLFGEESNKGEADCHPIVRPLPAGCCVPKLRYQELADSVAVRLNLGSGLFLFFFFFARLHYFLGHFITWNTVGAR